MKKTVSTVLFFLVTVLVFGGEDLEKGILAFRESNNALAVQLLEKAMASDPGNDEIHVYLGLVYLYF